MPSPVDLVNRALSHLGTQSQVQSLTENSTEALHAAIHYDPMRSDLLRKYNWGFARKQVNLALLKAAAGTPENSTGTGAQPPTPYLYEYAKPADSLMERAILPLIPPLNVTPPIQGGVSPGRPLAWGPAIKFTAALDTDANGNNISVILTDQQQAILIYTANVTDPNLFDVLFQTALVGRLAAALVIPLSGDKALAKIAIQDGEKAELEAAVKDGQEGLHVINNMPEWMRARGFAADFTAPPFGFPAGGFFPGSPGWDDTA